MAKGKHAAALFEVIHGSRNIDTKGGSALRTPKWWFKGRPEAEVPGPVETEPATSGPSPSGNVAPRIAAVEAMPAAPEIIQSAPSRREPAATSSRAVGRSGGQVKFDGDRHEVTMRVRYTTAIVSGFAVLVALGLSYVVGRHMAGGPETASASGVTAPTNAVDEVPHVAIKPSVMEVHHPKVQGPGTSHGMDPVKPHDPTHGTGTSAGTGAGRNPPPVPPAVPAADAPRVAGLNYVIAQSYPDEKSAKEARDFLVKSGIGCTVVQGPADFTHESWFSVVGTRGFDHIHTPECDAYKKAILDANDRFAGTFKFKRFDPHMYRWK
ncbi:MAG: hypothetical protein JWN24_4953 [Phycisphaerales bacterium]|nr:hypothetical protein [Phycisphaerales bacterium]